MRKCLPTVSLLFSTFLLTQTASAQPADKFAYAITDVQQQGSQWSFLRKLNLETGEYSQVLLSGNDDNLLAFDAGTRKQLQAPLNDARYGKTINAAFATNVAAVAYDRKNNRLYYTPMLIDQLRYIDLRTMKVYFVTGQGFTGKAQKSSTQGDIVTRMTIGADGNGYAMTNDGTQLIRFTTGKKAVITDLGSIVDDQANKDVSVHNSCTSYGGDMIADDDGNLYIFSARNHVFKVNIESKVATHLGAITGLPAGFTSNGAAVNEKNQVILSSATIGSAPFIVDTKKWTASPFTTTGTVWYSSDLANSNLLVSGNRPEPVNSDLISVVKSSNDSRVSIYPNPATNNKFVLQFNKLEAGNYTVQITDVTGRQVLQQAISISGENQAQQMQLSAGVTRGVYLVQVVDKGNKTVFSNKLVLQ